MTKLEQILEAEDGIFGKIAFGGDTLDDEYGDEYVTKQLKKMQGFKSKDGEPDNKHEKSTLEALASWISDPEDGEGKLLRLRTTLATAKIEYPELFAPRKPNGTILYRGLNNPSEGLLEVLRESSDKNWKKAGGWYVLKKPIVYTPRRGVQSWTLSKRVAAVFASELDETTIVLSTKQSSQFMFNDKFINLLSRAIVAEMNEQEVIHVGQKYIEPVHLMLSKHTFEEL